MWNHYISHMMLLFSVLCQSCGVVVTHFFFSLTKCTDMEKLYLYIKLSSHHSTGSKHYL